MEMKQLITHGSNALKEIHQLTLNLLYENLLL